MVNQQQNSTLPQQPQDAELTVQNGLSIDENPVYTGHQHSLKRWFKQLFYFHPKTRQYFNQTVRDSITQAVRNAEMGHTGEVKVVIEGCLPLASAYHQNTLWRARQLFAQLGVWDTAFNSGVLLYINICEKKVEIVADRGISHYVTANQWQHICDDITAQFAQAKFANGVVSGVTQIGALLAKYYTSGQIDLKNELGDAPIMM